MIIQRASHRRVGARNDLARFYLVFNDISIDYETGKVEDIHYNDHST